jgi:hypothetical protein
MHLETFPLATFTLTRSLRPILMSLSVVRRHVALAGALGAALLSRPVAAQSSGEKRVPETRAQLIARARVADSLGRRDEAFQIRARLNDGDFDVGDVILASYEGAQTLGLNGRDSLVVTAGRVLSMRAPLGDLDLHGVLRFEISDLITQRVAKYYKDEVVRVTPLLRLSVSGAARSPGFFQVRPDEPLSDVIMRAGQAPDADLRSVEIRRGDQTVWQRADVQTAFSDGLTVEQLELRPGDEVVIGTDAAVAKHAMWVYVAQIGLTVISAVALSFLYRRR